MHFALPPRKTSHPPPYARAAAARNSSDRRRKLYQLSSYIVLGTLTIYLILRYAFSSHQAGAEDIEQLPAGIPPVVIVTVFDDEQTSPDYIQKVKANREDYASRHGKATRRLLPCNPIAVPLTGPLHSQVMSTFIPIAAPTFASTNPHHAPGHSSLPSATL
jgi:hypothetical protein